jgi:hypothetical protein
MSDPEDRQNSERHRSETGTASPPEEEALRAAGRMLAEGRELARDYLDLLAVEGQLAGRSLVLMLALAIALGIVLVAAWIILNLAGVMWMVESETLSASQALLTSAVAHLVMALLIWLSVRHLSRNLVFGGFRRALHRQGSPDDLEGQR